MPKLIDETGNQYGRLTVIERAPNRKNTGSAYWLCQCRCGKWTVVLGKHLRSGVTKSCGCLKAEKVSKRRLIDETGNKYGLLTVIERAQNAGNGNARWVCQCACGRRTISRGVDLRSGYTKSCGCLRRLQDGEGAFNSLLLNYKSGAKVRGLKFSLTDSEFRELTQQPCHYCGAPPSGERTSLYDTGSYIYTGVDRVDNDKGYVHGNVVPCCGTCNRAKGDMSYSDFRDYVDRLAEHRVGLRNGKTFPMWIPATRQQMSDPAQMNATIAQAWFSWVAADWMLQEPGGVTEMGRSGE